MEGGIHPAPGLSPAPGGAEAPRRLKPGLRVAILTDIHFWLPVGVLIFGIALLAVLR